MGVFRIAETKRNSVLSRSFSINGRGNQDIRTPIWFFDKLNRQFNFNLDPCDSIEKPSWLGINAYNLGRNEDGLIEEWNGNIFVNPPWNNIFPWIRKAEAELFLENARFIVLLVPSRTETKWFHHLLESEYLLNHRFLKSRMTFDDHENSFVIGISIFTLWRNVI